MATQLGLFDARRQEHIESEGPAVVPVIENHACDSGQSLDSGVRPTPAYRFTDDEIGRVADAIVKLENWRRERLQFKADVKIKALRKRTIADSFRPRRNG